MLMQAEPVYLAYEAIADKKVKKKPRVCISFSSGADVFADDGRRAGERRSWCCSAVIMRGSMERVLEEIVTDYVSSWRLCAYGGRITGNGDGGCNFKTDSGSAAQ